MDARTAELKKLSARIHEEEILARMKKVVAPQKDEEINLAEAALLISKLDNPEVAVEDYLVELDSLVGEFRKVMSDEEKADPLKATRRLVKWMFEENGFHGSQDDYYSKSNSYLNEVMDDREGLPVSLSVLFLELGWRLDLPVAGIPVPGHFVVQFRSKEVDEGGLFFGRRIRTA